MMAHFYILLNYALHKSDEEMQQIMTDQWRLLLVCDYYQHNHGNIINVCRSSYKMPVFFHAILTKLEFS
jgi:hypothetical protein